MNETQKPFACDVEECEMTFTNEDHLNLHKKRHDMNLNLTLAKNSDTADQTPTPTRFIRNCEEVGLFQDLQNVNVFDETFKKAIEEARNGTLHIPEASADDTLHTPHILPHVEEAVIKFDSTNTSQFQLKNILPEKRESLKSNDVSLNNPSIIISFSEELIKTNATDNTKGPENVKVLIKEKLQNKGKVNISSDVEYVVKKQIVLKPKNNQKKNDISESREKIREMNRAAQLRCRKRKKMYLKGMEEELALYKAEHFKLKEENTLLKKEIYQLKALIIQLEADKGTSTEESQPSSITTLKEVIFQSTVAETPSIIQPVLKNSRPILPKPNSCPLIQAQLITTNKSNTILVHNGNLVFGETNIKSSIHQTDKLKS